MNKLTSLHDLPQLREKFQQALAARAKAGAVIYVGMGTCGIAAGARETFQAIEQKIAKHKLPATVVSVGCIGMCAKEPLVDIQLNGGSHVLYANIQADMVPRLIEEHVINHHPVREWVICRMTDGEVPADEPQAIQNLPQFNDLPFGGKQVRIALGNCGLIDPEKIEDYIAREGYRALGRVLGSWSPEEVIKEIKESGLRGRGGGGFPTGIEMGILPQIARRHQIRHLQRRRRRSRRVHGPLDSRKRSARRARRHGHRRLRDGRARRHHLLPRGISAGHRAARRSHWPGQRTWPARRKYSRHEIQFRHFAQGRRRRVCVRRGNRAHRVHRRPARRTASASAVPRRQRSCGASRATSTT